MQICHIEADAEKNHQETLSITNNIKEAILKNNQIFAEKWELTHARIDHCLEEHLFLKTHIVELESLSGLQQTSLQHCQDKIAGLEETVTQVVMSVKKLEKLVCWCHNRLLLPGPHYAPGEEEEVVRATLPPSTLFADRALLRRGYSISEPNTLVETVSKYKDLY